MKNCPMIPEFPFSSILRWGSSSVSIVKSASFEVACCFYKSTMRPCMGYSFHDLVGAPSWSSNIWDKLQKREFRSVNHSLETLCHCLNVATLSLFCRYRFGRCLSEPAKLFLLPYLLERSTHYSNRLHDFSVTILWCFKDVCVSKFVHGTARLEFSACRMLCLELL